MMSSVGSDRPTYGLFVMGYYKPPCYTDILKKKDVGHQGIQGRFSSLAALMPHIFFFSEARKRLP